MEDLNNKVDNDGIDADGILPATEWNQVATELQAIIVSTGVALSGGDLFQVGTAIANFAQGDVYWGNDTGSGTAYVVSPVNSIFVAHTLFTGMHVRFRPANDNTSTTPTLNAYGTSAKTIIAENGTALVAGDLSTTRDAELRYDGTNWRLLGRSLGLVAGGTYHQGFISGFNYTNDGSDALHDINLNIGKCINDVGQDFNLDFGTATTKQIDATWAAGDAAGGLASALHPVQPNTWYRIIVIGGPIATTDWGFDNSANATNLLNDAGVNFTKYRTVGWVLTDGSSNIIPFKQDLDDYTEVRWNTYAEDVDNTAPDVSPGDDVRQLDVLQVPPSSIAIMRVSVECSTSDYAGESWLDVISPFLPDTSPDDQQNIIHGVVVKGNIHDEVIMNARVNSSSEIAWRFKFTGVASESDIQILTLGFRFSRAIF